VGVARRSIRAESRYPAPAGPKNCHGARRAWRGFCRLGTNFCELYECRYNVDREQVTSHGTQSLKAGTGAVAVYAITNLSWEQEKKQKP